MGYKTEWFKGIFPALVTPFTTHDTLDEAAYRQLIRFVLPHVDGVVPCGTTGEFSYLTPEERKRAIAVCLDEVAGRVPVIAGTGCPSTRETVALTGWAQGAGVTAALVVAPYFLKPTFNEVYDHFRAVDQVGLPFVLYNIPQCAGTHFRWWTAEGMLLDFDHTIGIKDSSGDLPFMEAMFEKVKGRVAIFVGHDEVVQPALAAGADGAILASANLIPDVWQRVYRATLAGDLETAQRWQQRVQKLVRIVVRCGSTQAVKEGLGMMGLPVGHSRHPVVPGGAFRREDRDELRLQLELAGVDKIPKAPVTFDLGRKQVQTELFATPQTPRTISGFTLKVGEGFAGPPFTELAHVDLLLGLKDGPVGRAIERALAGWGEERGLRIINERPRTLLVPTVTLRTARQRRLFEHAAEGVNLAIRLSVEDGFLPEGILDEVALIVNAFVHPAASIAKRVDFNNYKATRYAIRKALEGRPTVEELIDEKAAARHPFRYAP
ncbi:MAG TPA: dihydrodipicolinate synthase family protein [Anaerolineae bacterium]|nr:dihydrodipicolinate synthase family protein [Anaerolineae bacterium]